MKRFTILLLLSSTLCLAEEVKLTRPAILKGERNMVALKKDAVVEVLGRDEKNQVLSVRYGKVTGTIPMASITDGPAAIAAEPPKREQAPSPSAPSAPPPSTGKATTNYGRAVEKAKENAAKHDKNLVRPTDEILN